MQGNSIPNHEVGAGPFVVVDVETSGLHAASDRVLSVAAIAVDEQSDVIHEFHTLIDPGCDPGPVHIHGLTRARLHGSPRFDQVRDQLSEVLDGRVMVAHNARFDYDFLAGEFRRTGAILPIRQRLCTLAFARAIAPPLPDFRLASLAAHYGVEQRRAHDALDDSRVLVGVLKGLLEDATRLGMRAPLLQCPPKDTNRHLWRGKPKMQCGFVYPGRMTDRGPLVQGMKVAITGDTTTDRNALIDKAEAAGLDVTGAVSRLTSVLVTNDPQSGTGKAAKAREYGTPIISEARFLELLGAVLPGADKRADTQSGSTSSGARAKRKVEAAGPLSDRRILVLGGQHAEAVEMRKRITELGGSVAVNLSASVTDVLVLPGGETDKRLARAATLGLPIWGPELLEPGRTADTGSVGVPDREFTVDPVVLARGQVVDLPTEPCGNDWTLRAAWHPTGTAEVDIVVFLVDGSERVRGDSDFVFYNQPETDGVRLTVDGPTEQSLTIAIDELPDHCRRIVLAAALDGPVGTFGDLGPIELEAATPEAAPMVRATLDAATEERTLILAEIYERAGNWRVRAVGQGYSTDLAVLARSYGVEVSD
ncbi:exonuclease domain-containing protein [Nocardia sp. CC201C]|uniref:exonuclease domain-containing protein n=1 Tax=Nocardia sp. CC201C TaxID=3044575 RepID=UPI0024A9BDAC|nr:exonuclease domain-containing protein [Nocardia sp. CC201C]